MGRVARICLLGVGVAVGCGRMGYERLDATGSGHGLDAQVVDRDGEALHDAARLPPDAGEPPGADAAIDDAGSLSGECLPWPDDVAFEAPEPLTALNSPSPEAQPHLSPDGLELFFASNRGGWDLFVASRASTDEPFLSVRRVDELATPGEDVSLALSSDGLTAYFSSNREGALTPDIFVARREAPGLPFGTPARVDELSTDQHDYDPFLAWDGLSVYFSRATIGVEQHVFVAHRDGPSVPFGAVRPLELLGSDVREDNPSLTADGTLLVFAAQLPGGSGDLYRASRTDGSSLFTAPRPISALNTEHSESESFVTPDGCAVYFTSDRPGGTGDHDIYFARRQGSGG